MNTPPVKVYTVNAFCEDSRKGNPAGVCALDAFPADEQMQSIAKAMGLSETAFVVARGLNHFDLRWFTPTQEVPLCGHATLATAHWLRERAKVNANLPVVFETKSGQISVRYDGERVVMDLPKKPGRDLQPGPELAGCLDTGKRRNYHRNDASYLVEVADLQALEKCGPHMDSIKQLDSDDLLVTTATGLPPGFDYAYRCFCPQLGIPEDPVTGSANCLLAPYWQQRLGKDHFRVLQASKEGGVLDVTIKGDTVQVGGKALTIPGCRIVTTSTKDRPTMEMAK